MLESQVLLLRPPAGGSRVIADAGRGSPVGFARWQPPEGGWWGRLFGPVLCVHEQEEAPLVFTVRRDPLWWAQRAVYDAEGFCVGYVTGRGVRDRNHLLYAQAQPGGGGVVYEGRTGEPLASAVPTAEGLELTFTQRVERDPFAKKLLLAAALFQQ